MFLNHPNVRAGKTLLLAFAVFAPVAQGQLPKPIPPATTPGTTITNLNSQIGYVRAKASPDECWSGLGSNTRWDFINQVSGQPPCTTNQIPKVDQGYIWGQTVVGSQIYFGSFSNPECLGVAINNTAPAPVNYPNAYACEFADSPYATGNGGPLPSALADFRPPRMYVYNVSTKTVADITPTLAAYAAATACKVSPPGPDPLCVDSLWYTTVGVRSATSYVEPTTGHTYVIVTGQAFVAKSMSNPNGLQNALNIFIYGITEGRWVAKYQYVGYSDVRHWLNYNGVLYAAAFKGPQPSGGALLRFTGSLATVPAVPTTNSAGNAIALCGTTSNANPTGVPAASACIAFQDVGDFDTPASEVVVATTGPDAGSIFVGTWPEVTAQPTLPPETYPLAGIWMSPVVPTGGLTSANASQWTKVWTTANYEPDPVSVTQYAIGAMAFYEGNLYWGTLNPILSSVRANFKVYGKPADTTTLAEFAIAANRTAVLFNGQGFSTGTPTVNLLYGQAQLPVYVPATSTAAATFQLEPNNVPSGTCTTACGTAPLYGASGFNNIWTNYVWSMAVTNSRLYIGTMNWAYLAYLGEIYPGDIPAPTVPTPPQFGGQLYYFANTTSAAIPVSLNGVGNFLNYGVRNIIPYSSSMYFIGTANPMNLATTPNTGLPGAACVIAACQGGWELIEMDTGSTVIVR